MDTNKKYGFIYITTNLINGKKYLGQKISTTKGEKYYLGSGILLKKAVKKYGRKNFKLEIIDYANSQDELNELEKSYIKKFNAVEDKQWYNIADGGLNGNPFAGKTKEDIAKFFNDEWKQKISETHSGGLNPAAKKYCLIKDNEIIKIFNTRWEAIKGEWRLNFPKPNGINYLEKCMRENIDFHGHYLIKVEEWLNVRSKLKGKESITI